MSSLPPGDYPALLEEIKGRIRSAQYDALKAVNKEQIGLYGEIGRMIAERQKEASWGKAVVEQLVAHLRVEFPGMRGFSRRNIFYMRELYLCYRDQEKMQPIVAQIGWSHNLIILEKCERAGSPLEKGKQCDWNRYEGMRAKRSGSGYVTMIPGKDFAVQASRRALLCQLANSYFKGPLAFNG